MTEGYHIGCLFLRLQTDKIIMILGINPSVIIIINDNAVKSNTLFFQKRKKAWLKGYQAFLRAYDKEVLCRPIAGSALIALCQICCEHPTFQSRTVTPPIFEFCNVHFCLVRNSGYDSIICACALPHVQAFGCINNVRMPL